MAMTEAAAAVSRADGHQEDENQYVTFMLGREMLAMGILAVKEILEFGQPTEVPMMPPYVRGVINLRGAVVPVIDLSLRLGRGGAALTKKACIVIVETGSGASRQTVGAVVDAVNAVIEIDAGDIEPPPSFGSSIRNDFVSGIGRVNEQFVVILNADRLLSMGELSAATEHSHVAAAAA